MTIIEETYNSTTPLDWLKQANLDETEVQQDFDAFKENLSREQFLRERK